MDNKQRTILIADDAEINRDLLRMLFENDYNIIAASNGEEAIEALASNKDHIAMLFLDLVMPKKNGLDVLAYMNDTGLISNVPVIMVTSRDSEADEVLSMSYGADDYITKPYNPTILLLRINAVFKRLGAKSDNTTTYRGMEILPHKGVIKYKDDEITLTKNEMTIFMYLLSHREHIVSRDELMTELWNNEEYLNDNALTVNISRLRGRFKDIGLEDVIETRKGQGYILV